MLRRLDRDDMQVAFVTLHAVQQAIGTHRGNEAAATFLQAFSQHAIRSGLVASLIAKHHVQGLSVAPVAALA